MILERTTPTQLPRRILDIFARTRVAQAEIDRVIASLTAPPPSPLDRERPKTLNRTQRRQWRVDHGLCKEGGCALSPDDKKNLCAWHAENRTAITSRWRDKHPDQVTAHYDKIQADRKADPEKWNAFQRKRYNRNAEARKCTSCKADALPGVKVCAKHQAANRAKSLKWQKANPRSKRRRAELDAATVTYAKAA